MIEVSMDIQSTTGPISVETSWYKLMVLLGRSLQKLQFLVRNFSLFHHSSMLSKF